MIQVYLNITCNQTTVTKCIRIRVLDYSFLTLGTYGTLREVEFIQNMNKMCPQIRGYYIGLYIPTVPKMLYKGKLQPSYLLCPEKCTWHLLNDGKKNSIDIALHFSVFTLPKMGV